MVHGIYSLACFPYMCAKAYFRDLLRSLCLQDWGLGWKKNLTVANVWVKLIHLRPHGWSLIKVILSFNMEAVRAPQDHILLHPALLPLVAIMRGWPQGTAGGETRGRLGMLNLHTSSSPKGPRAHSISSRSLIQVGSTLKHLSMDYCLH